MLQRLDDGEFTIVPDPVPEPPAMTVKDLVAQCYKMAVDKGWAERQIPVTEQIALIHSEASEALESWRNNEPFTWTDKDGKPQGLASEYADIIIRIGHYVVLNGIDLEAELKRKMAFNATRPHRHGGKLA